VRVQPGDVVWLSTQLGANQRMAKALAHAVPGVGVTLIDWPRHVVLARDSVCRCRGCA
jgi:hypothetical protein